MDRFQIRRAASNIAVFVAVALLGIWSLSQGDRGGGTFLIVGAMVAMWWAWPTRGPHVDEAQARADIGPDDVIVYWRPGCPYCARLSLASRLTSWPAGSPRRHQVNIWRDPEAAGTVRALRNGFETVPTVVDADGNPIEATVGGIKARRPLPTAGG